MEMCSQGLTGQHYPLETDSPIVYVLSIGNKHEKFVQLFHEHPIILDLKFHLYFKMCEQLHWDYYFF